MSPRLLPLLSGFFAIVAAGRIYAQVEAQADGATPTSSDNAVPKVASPSDFAVLDEWERELTAREAEAEANALAGEIYLDQARQQAERLARQKEAEAVTTDRLAKIYAAMSPTEAAATMAALPAGRAAEILTAMMPDAAGGILSQMAPEIRSEVAIAMAARG
jgi:flagellar motility protein MotE (MotC chaperone)